ncbi:MAG: YeeE/YedE family protein [Proteobacteria bacterium]|nr:YeeE/YedE family protein [Pseudomonadota bacterium]
MRILITLVSGFLFGVGLILSGMSNPLKVSNFLDVFGNWDPSLAFVMGGAIIVTMPGFWLIQRRKSPFFHDFFHLPTQTEFDMPLVAGASIFGIGWGLAGFCPGPALTSLPFANTGTLIFVLAMLSGMMSAKFVTQRMCQT